MARPQKKNSPKKKSRAQKKFTQPRRVFKFLVGLVILLLLLLLAGLVTHVFMQKKRPLETTAGRTRPTATDSKKPTYEIYPEKDFLSSKQRKAPAEPFEGEGPKIALIIDDIGYDSKIVKKFIRLKAPLTLSILPQSPQKKRILDFAQAAQLEIMLHQPMEPNEYPKINPGPGTLLTGMSPDERIHLLTKNLNELPQVKGVNNHMGSRMTRRSDQMRQVFSVLKERGLFFVDSRTTPETICRMSARLLQVPFGERDVFIDHRHQADFIEKQVKELLRIAQAHGEAIGIAHPHETTFQVLQKMIPQLRQSVTFVPVSTLVKPVS